jgi:hypothetical protein
VGRLCDRRRWAGGEAGGGGVIGGGFNALDIQEYREEWGIPDWQIEETYGLVQEWNLKRWQWEFYRRRDVVRKYFDARAEDQYKQNQEFFELCPEAFQGRPPAKPTESGFQVGVAHEDRNDIGYTMLPNPRIAAQPDLAIFPCSGAARVRAFEPPRAGSTLGELFELANVELTARQRLLLAHDFLKYRRTLETTDLEARVVALESVTD